MANARQRMDFTPERLDTREEVDASIGVIRVTSAEAGDVERPYVSH